MQRNAMKLFKQKRIPVWLMLWVLTLAHGYAQTTERTFNTLSPYSLSAIGELESDGFVRNEAKMGLGLSRFSLNHYSLLNPATLGFVNKTVFDFGLRYDRVTLNQGENYNDQDNGNFNYLALAFNLYNNEKVSKADTSEETGRITGKNKTTNRFNWSAGFSLSPYSSIGSQFFSELDTLGLNALVQNQNSGGLTRVATQTGMRFGEFVSVGYSFGFVWGDNDRGRRIFLPDTQGAINLTESNRQRYRSFNHNLGVGIHIPFTDLTSLNFAGSYQPGFTLQTIGNRMVLALDRRTPGTQFLDTILVGEEQSFELDVPERLSFGASFLIKHRIMIGADYHMQNWSQASLWNQNLTDYNKWVIGVTINPETKATRSMRKPEIYFGYSQSSLHASYRNLNGNLMPIQENGISFGIGLPVVRDVFGKDGKRERITSMIHLSAQYVQRGGDLEGLINEDLFRVGMALSLTDIWFVKRKYR